MYLYINIYELLIYIINLKKTRFVFSQALDKQLGLLHKVSITLFLISKVHNLIILQKVINFLTKAGCTSIGN